MSHIIWERERKKEYTDTPDGWTTRTDLIFQNATLTERDKELLRKKFGKARIDYLRAARVKEKMGEGMSVRDISRSLYPAYGKGYSLRSLTPIHAALSQSVGEGLKKRSKKGFATYTKKLSV